MANEMDSLTCRSCSPTPCLSWEFKTRNGYKVRVCEVCRATAKIEFHEKEIARLRARIAKVLADRSRQQEVTKRMRELNHV